MRTAGNRFAPFSFAFLRRRSLLFLLALLNAGALGTPALAGFPASGEDLTYTINWPSGLNLGEGRMRASRSGDGPAERWRFELEIEAGIPGFTVRDQYRSTTSANLCSFEFAKDSVHGTRKSQETTEFDPAKRSAVRVTAGGGKTEFPVPECARDALAFLFHARRELAQGRVPPPDTIYFGGPYSLRLQYTGEQIIRVNNKPVTADRLVASVKGKASDWTFELYFARDPARTPVAIRVPFALGTFSMELAR